MDTIIKAVAIEQKWMLYRETVRRFLVEGVGKDMNEGPYHERMMMVQTIIKNTMENKKMELLDAVIHLGSTEENPYATMQILAAGYELCEGNDFTNYKIKKTNGIKSKLPL